MQLPKLPFGGGRGTADLEAQAAQGQAAVETFEWSEHAKWGRFLQDTERELMEAWNAELARPRPSSNPGGAPAGEDAAPEVEA
jgi:hypothetical protein